jgi:hypothetical protein
MRARRQRQFMPFNYFVFAVDYDFFLATALSECFTPDALTPIASLKGGTMLQASRSGFAELPNRGGPGRHTAAAEVARKRRRQLPARQRRMAAQFACGTVSCARAEAQASRFWRHKIMITSDTAPLSVSGCGTGVLVSALTDLSTICAALVPRI